jgi:hypothetical protein
MRTSDCGVLMSANSEVTRHPCALAGVRRRFHRFHYLSVRPWINDDTNEQAHILRWLQETLTTINWASFWKALYSQRHIS